MDSRLAKNVLCNPEASVSRLPLLCLAPAYPRIAVQKHHPRFDYVCRGRHEGSDGSRQSGCSTGYRADFDKGNCDAARSRLQPISADWSRADAPSLIEGAAAPVSPFPEVSAEELKHGEMQSCEWQIPRYQGGIPGPQSAHNSAITAPDHAKRL